MSYRSRYNPYSEPRISEGMLKILFYLVAIVILFAIAFFLKMPNRITEVAAVQRFYEISNAEKIEIVRHSNNSLVFGDTRDVTFELVVDGKPTTGRCTSAMYSPMVCRLYSSE